MPTGQQPNGDSTTGPAASGPDHVGRYPVSGVLGSGGFGTVYRGVHPDTGVTVAVKVLDHPGETWRRDLLRSEAAAMLAVDHPNCVGLLDVIDEPDTAAIVTEFIEGASLRTVLDQAGHLDGPQALYTLEGALAGLAAVHDVGLVHADLKPDNILVGTDGRSRLIDFGLATPPRHLLGEDGFMGTPPYISPEQVTGSGIDARSDIYSTGVVLFELLCGETPYRGSGPWQTARMHIEAETPDPRGLDPEIGAGLAALCMKDLAKDPAARHQSAFAFHGDLDAAATETYGPDWRNRAGMAAAVVGALAAGVPAGAALLGGGVGASATVIGSAGAVTALGAGSASAVAGATAAGNAGVASAASSAGGAFAGPTGGAAAGQFGGTAAGSLGGTSAGGTASAAGSLGGTAASGTAATGATGTSFGTAAAGTGLAAKAAIAVGGLAVVAGGALVGTNVFGSDDGGGDVVVASTFSDDAEGWRTENDVTDFGHVDSGGNPGGHLTATDVGTGATWYWVTPEDWSGDRGAAAGGTLEFDLIQSSDDPDHEDMDVIVRSVDGDEAVFELDEDPGTDWTSYSVPLTDDEWIDPATGDALENGDLADLLANLGSISIRGEYVTGADIGGLDNVSLRRP